MLKRQIRTMQSVQQLALIHILFLCLFSCEEHREPRYERIPTLETLQGALTAYCDMDFTDRGRIDIERDYLPHVINCENGAASFEALKAQAVAARSYLYYKLHNYGSIGDGQGDQVYSCNREPSSQHYAAVEATSGEVLTYQNEVIAAFYVAGAIPTPPMCVGMEDDPDPHNTERYVTYNQGKSGDELIQTTLGWVDPGNIYNRGCKSQNGAACLADAGVAYPDILRFYYGADITIERSEGDCIMIDLPIGGEVMGGELPAGDLEGGMVAGLEDEGGQRLGGAVAGNSMGGDVLGGEEEGGEIEAGQQTGGEQEGGELTSGDSLTGGEPINSLPYGPAICPLNEQEASFELDASCATLSCQGEQRWARGNGQYILSCQGDEECRGGWTLRAEVPGRYAVGIDASWRQLEIERGAAYQPDTLPFSISISGSPSIEGEVFLSENGITLLGDIELEVAQELVVMAPNQCPSSELSVNRLVIRKLNEGEDPAFGPRIKSSGGPSCSVQEPSQRSTFYALIFIALGLLLSIIRQSQRPLTE